MPGDAPITTTSTFEPLHAIAGLLAEFDRPWAICGGWTLDLFLNRVTRPHKDIDVAIRRVDQLLIQEYLMARGWDLQIAHDDVLTPWAAGEWVELPRHGVWATHPSARPDFLELLLNEADDAVFRFRRDQRITLGIDQAFISAPIGLPILAPELALLYKSGHPDEPENAADLGSVLPALNEARRAWLRAAIFKLDPSHPWLAHIRA